MSRCALWHGDCLDVMATLDAGSVDAIVTDPPYAEISRDYGRLTESAWHTLMDGVVEQARRVLKPTGSAVFVLQANQARVGSMRPWLYEFVAKWARQWNVVQDAYWWNFSAPPTVHCHRTRGLMRPSVKLCVWLGAPDCYRNQDAVLWEPSEATKHADRADRALTRLPSGQSMRRGRCCAASDERGGVTPFNLIPIANANSASSAGAHGHGAGTPLDLCRWWVRYLTPPGGLVLDPFTGSGTTGVACALEGMRFVGIEQVEEYADMAMQRLRAVRKAQREAVK